MSNDSEGLPQNAFDRRMMALEGIPDSARTKPSTIQVVATLLGHTATWTINTVRQRDIGDTVFVQCGDASGLVRLAIPPEVADVIARQRDALTAIIRRRHGKRIAQERKAAGLKPGFMQGGARKGKGRGAR